jgi:hypothetical protein
VTSGCNVLVIFQFWTRVSLHARIIFKNKKTRVGLFLALYNIQLSKLKYFYFLCPRQISWPQKSRNARACTCFWYVVRRFGVHNILKFYSSGTSGNTLECWKGGAANYAHDNTKYLFWLIIYCALWMTFDMLFVSLV